MSVIIEREGKPRVVLGLHGAQEIKRPHGTVVVRGVWNAGEIYKSRPNKPPLIVEIKPKEEPLTLIGDGGEKIVVSASYDQPDE